MAVKSKLMRTEWWPQPHDINGGIAFELDDSTLDSTIIPFAFYDEGMGTPSALETHPENAAFAIQRDEANCFVNSRINNIVAELRFGLTSKAIDDNIPAICMAYMPIFMAFKEDYDAADELSGNTVKAVLEMQTESTDRQGFPLYVAGKDMAEHTAGHGDLGANQPGLDTDQGIEAVAFSTIDYYDMLHFGTIRSKLRATQGGLKWFNLTPTHPFRKVRFFIRPKVKRMNEYTFYGVLVHVPKAGFVEQLPNATEITAVTNYVTCYWNIRFNEWNQDFNFKKI